MGEMGKGETLRQKLLERLLTSKVGRRGGKGVFSLVPGGGKRPLGDGDEVCVQQTALIFSPRFSTASLPLQDRLFGKKKKKNIPNESAKETFSAFRRMTFADKKFPDAVVAVVARSGEEE